MVVLICAVRPVVGKHPELSRKLPIVCDNGPSVSVGAKILPWVEAERTRSSHQANLPILILGQMCLRTVLHDK